MQYLSALCSMYCHTIGILPVVIALYILFEMKAQSSYRSLCLLSNFVFYELPCHHTLIRKRHPATKVYPVPPKRQSVSDINLYDYLFSKSCKKMTKSNINVVQITWMLYTKCSHGRTFNWTFKATAFQFQLFRFDASDV